MRIVDGELVDLLLMKLWLKIMTQFELDTKLLP
jgi:hypothetical protein